MSILKSNCAGVSRRDFVQLGIGATTAPLAFELALKVVAVWLAGATAFIGFTLWQERLFRRKAERGVAEGATPFRHRDEVLPVPLDLLTPASLQMIDSTIIRAHQHAAGAKRGIKKKVLGALAVASRPKSI